MSATDVHAPDFARRLTAALLDLKRAEAAWETACATAATRLTDRASERPLVVAIEARRLTATWLRLGEARREFEKLSEIIETSVRLELELKEPAV